MKLDLWLNIKPCATSDPSDMFKIKRDGKKREPLKVRIGYQLKGLKTSEKSQWGTNRHLIFYIISCYLKLVSRSLELDMISLLHLRIH